MTGMGAKQPLRTDNRGGWSHLYGRGRYSSQTVVIRHSRMRHLGRYATGLYISLYISGPSRGNHQRPIFYDLEDPLYGNG